MSVTIRKWDPPEDECKGVDKEQSSDEQWSLTRELETMIASTPEHLAEMKRQATESIFVLPEIAISGQITIINASPNAGKTLLTCWLLSQRDQQARETLKTYFINADDTFDGGRFKGEFMRGYEIETLIPEQRGFSTDKFKMILEKSISTKSARGVVFILDTLKKFVDMMDKTAARSTNDLLRKFVQAGGTIIALAHVNKNKDGNGSSVAEGVGDFQNDFDAAYTIEVAGDSESGTRTVIFKTPNREDPTEKRSPSLIPTLKRLRGSNALNLCSAWTVKKQQGVSLKLKRKLITQRTNPLLNTFVSD